MPSKEKVCEDVKYYISNFANYPFEKIKNEYVLVGPPLEMDKQQLTFLAIALRAYIKNINPAATLLAKELKKSGMTVQGLCNLVYKRIVN